MFALSKKYLGQALTAYAYNLSQTNTTLGFIKLYLPEVRKMYEFRDAVFLSGQAIILNDSQVERLQTFYNFKGACKIGTIGLKALEPANLRAYMPKGSMLYAQGKDYKFSDEDSYLNYQLYRLWIIAMLNKTELLNLATQVAQALKEFEKTTANDRGTKEKARLSEELRTSASLKTFIDKITEVLGLAPQNADAFRQVVVQVLKMPTDNFPLFATLIRFEYQYLKSKNSL